MAAAVKISLIPTELDLALYAGDGVEFSVILSDSAGHPLPVDGEVLAQIRGARSDVNPATAFAADLTDGDTGIVWLSLTGVQTGTLVKADGNQFNGVWDMQWTPTGGQPVTVLQGKITCDADVTR